MTAQSHDDTVPLVPPPPSVLSPDLPPVLHTLHLSPHHRVALRLEEIDAARAALWLTTYHYPRQRAAYPSLARMYAEQMRQGDWRSSTLMLCDYEGPAQADLPRGTYLVNGRNRLTAVIEAGRSVPFLVEHHATDRPQDVHDLYQVQDRGRSRAIADVFRSIGLDEELGLSIGELRMLSEAHEYLTTDFSGTRRVVTNPFARADFLRSWIKECRVWLTCVAGGRNKIRNYLTASPITAVALVTLQGQPERAETFWSATCADDGLLQGTAEKTTFDWIIENRVRTMPAHYYARYIAAGWNAAYLGHDISRLIVRDLEGPINILGTAYESRRMQRRAVLRDRVDRSAQEEE